MQLELDTDGKVAEVKTKPLAIVGTGYKWNLCPWNNPDWEYWALNNMHIADDKNHYTQWFQLHQIGSGEGHIDDPIHKEFLKGWTKPIWLQKEEYIEKLEIRKECAYIYPFDTIVDRFCPRDLDGVVYPYFTNSIDYMICLGAFQGFNPIYLYGVEFVSEIDDEYYKMRQSLEYYIGKITAMGTTIGIQKYSALLKSDYVYAWERKPLDTMGKLFTTSIEKLEGEKLKAENAMISQKLEVATRDGAIQTLKQIQRMMKLKEKGVQL
jgi:hypothetical protein